MGNFIFGDQALFSKKMRRDSLGDSILLFSLGLSVFFWMFNALLRFIDVPDLGWKMIWIGTEIQFYEKLVVSTLFIVFGSHIKTNIKKRKEAEDNLQVSEEKYRIILESIQEGYYEIDLEGNFIFVNPSMCKILARKEQNILGNNIASYISELDQETYSHFLQKILKSPEDNSTVECEIIVKGGAKKIIEMSGSLIQNELMENGGIRGIVKDVTEKKLLEKSLINSLEDVKEARAGVILGLAKLAEYRDTDTGKHLERIREYSKVIAARLSKHEKYQDYITEQYVEDIYQSSILHDIGKVGIPDSILMKKGKLTEDEYNKIKIHTLLGGRTISMITQKFTDQTFLTIAKEIAYYHHEKWNGNGYPKQLKGEEIPLSARIVAIADVYDALTSKRAYKEAFSHDKAKNIILSDKGKSFDPEIVDAFLDTENTFMQIAEKYYIDGGHGESHESRIMLHREYDA